MSAGAQIAVLAPGGRARHVEHAPAPAARPLIHIAAFGALALYGVLRWATLLNPAPIGRLLGLFAVAIALAGPGRAIARRSRTLAALGAIAAVLALFPLSGVPLSWVVHMRVAVTSDAIGQGLSALPQVFVPYVGVNEWIRIVIVLGAGVLLIDAGLMLALTSGELGDLRRTAAALPLVALAVVPSTLARPHLPYLQGLILFVLLAAFMWGERIPRYDVASAVVVLSLAGVGALVVAPALDQHRPWVNYQALAGTLSPAHVDRFSWTQQYGPLNWPRTGHEVLDVRASRPDYWKAENLELFDGLHWTGGSTQLGAQPPGPDPGVEAQWTQRIQVTIRSMRTSDVIASGTAAMPGDLPGAVPGVSVGTWIAGTELGPGDSYTVQVYSPHPSIAQLVRAGTEYPDQPLAGDRAILLPASASSSGSPAVLFPPFRSGLPIATTVGVYGPDAATIVRSSPYGRAYELAQRLASESATPYAFVAAVQRFLAHGFTYDENPPARRYPLESFLFADKRGYCQQFSGAMALLLRMGGIPARVAAGFTSGLYDNSNRRWVVSDLDAHAWVEVWFPHYGWVAFDPTPAAAPARGGHVPSPAVTRGAGKAKPPARVRKRDVSPAAATGKAARRHGGASTSPLVAIGIVLVALGAALFFAIYRFREPTGHELLTELERALARSGRPVAPGVTLAALEHRFRSTPQAADYVRAIRAARFGAGDRLPTAAERRALRAQLGAGLGIAGRLRALWALPPRARSRRARGQSRGGFSDRGTA